TNVRFIETPRNGGGRTETLLSFSNVRGLLEDCQSHVNRARKKTSSPPTSHGKVATSPDTIQLPDATAATDVIGDGGIWSPARDLVKQGQLGGLPLAQQHIQAATSGRDRFLRQLELSELCVQAQMHVFAYPIFDDLAKTVDERHLVEWEDTEVIRRIWSGLA